MLFVCCNYGIKSNLQRILNIKYFISQYNWKEINFPLHKKDWKKFRLNNKSIALNILFVPYNTKDMRYSHRSKHNLKHENQIIILMITDGRKCHYLAVKSLSALFKGIRSNHVGNFYCLNCFYSYSTKDKLKKHKNVCKIHDYCHVEMPTEDNKIFKYKHGKKSMKVSFIIYTFMESLIERTNTCLNNPKRSSTTKINKHTPSGYSLFTHCSFDNTNSKLDYYRGKDCIGRFCKDLKEHATKIICF